MKQFLLPDGVHSYKANLHTHSIHSDGCRTVEEIKTVYMKEGYSVVAFTDHDIMLNHSDLNEPEKFLALTSYEVETNPEENGRPWNTLPTYHLNFYASRPDETYYPCANPAYTFGNAPKYVQDYYRGGYVRRYSVEGQNEMIREAREHGFLVSYNHPAWSLQHYPDYAGLEGVTAVEVYNTGCVLEGYALDGDEQVLDDFLSLGKRVYPVAGDDSHGVADCCGGWVRFRAPALTYEAIMHAYAAGDFYASWGPEISNLYVEDGILHMDCEKTAAVYLRTDIRLSDRKAAPAGESLTHYTFDLRGWLGQSRALGEESRAFFRLTLVGADGSKALTRGYFADELTGITL